MESKNTVGAIALAVVLLLFIVGGYVAMRYFTEDNFGSGILPKKNEKIDIREDKSKDYLYFTNGEEFLEEEEIHREDAVFNFKSLHDLNDTLHSELTDMYKVTMVSDAAIPEGTEYRHNEKGYYSFTFREYGNTEFDKYVSLVVLDYNYDAINGSVINKLKSYVVDVNTGSLISIEDLLNDFKVTEDDIVKAIEKRLDDTQVMEEESSVINKEGTLESIKNSTYESGVKGLSVSKNGKLTINFIVKSNKINYNDSVEIN